MHTFIKHKTEILIQIITITIINITLALRKPSLIPKKDLNRLMRRLPVGLENSLGEQLVKQKSSNSRAYVQTWELLRCVLEGG